MLFTLGVWTMERITLTLLGGGGGLGFTFTGAFGIVDLELKLFRLQRISNGMCNVDRPYAISIRVQ